MHLRTVTFWGRLITGNQTKLSSILYRLLYKLDVTGVYSSPWLLNVKNILNECGLSYIWLSQNINEDIESFKNEIKVNLHDQYQQTWSSAVFQSPKCLNYRIFKPDLKFETYLTDLPQSLSRFVTKFRCRNHTLPIEAGCHKNTARHQRLCTKCESGELGDEYHYLFNCKFVARSRKKFLPTYCLTHPSTLKFRNIMNSENKYVQTKLARFIKIIYTSCGR